MYRGRFAFRNFVEYSLKAPKERSKPDLDLQCAFQSFVNDALKGGKSDVFGIPLYFGDIRFVGSRAHGQLLLSEAFLFPRPLYENAEFEIAVSGIERLPLFASNSSDLLVSEGIKAF